MTTHRIAAGTLTLFAFTTALLVQDGVTSSAYAKPESDKSAKLPIVRIAGSAKPKKADPPRAKGEAPKASPCAMMRYMELSAKRAALLKKHGGATPSFADEYAKEKQKLVSDAALEAIGCAR